MTFYDGDDLNAKVLGQYGGSKPHFKLYTSTADVTIQFQSDPATNIYGYNNGFIVRFFGESNQNTLKIEHRVQFGSVGIVLEKFRVTHSRSHSNIGLETLCLCF